MSKYISKFFLTLLACVILFFLLIGMFDGGDHLETWIFTFSTIIIILLSFLIVLVYYLIDLVKKKH
ncbi:hypothetical protein [Psychrobacillus antarcticus]|uniref:hypothetical protein n=1 Tax=Psychrobacillus antarcticus TaxID=2879115 RepID=UPI0024086E3D|nr:hypothetical protein [Psychrobacillus antarcticus]